MQDNEAGDGTNLLISLAGELMTQAENLIKMGLHPSEILIGYEKGAKKTMELLDTLSAYKSENIREQKELVKLIRTTVASKQFGLEDFLSGLIAEACIYATPECAKRFNIDNVRVQKILGGGISDSEVIHGVMVVRGSETSIRKAEKAKVAVFNTNIEM